MKNYSYFPHIKEEDQDSMRACVHAKLVQSCPTLVTHGLLPTRLFCPWDFQERILEWVVISFSLVFREDFSEEVAGKQERGSPTGAASPQEQGAFFPPAALSTWWLCHKYR